MQRGLFFGLFVLIAGSAVALAGRNAKSDDTVAGRYEQEMSRLLVKLELRTRGVIAKHYVDADSEHREWMIRNLLLPAAVADSIFHDVVPAATGDRAWVKMVVDKPRNPHNVGDATAVQLLDDVRKGRPHAERETQEAFYYAEPIRAAKTCLLCHGGPKGEPDPNFPMYKKEGWKAGEIVGAVVSRVERRAQ
ncbi:MAG: Tll0287-like domain-containing protein [Planctomycetota bacterium]